MAKEKKRNYDEKTKGELLSEETRNALLGILLFLLAVIGLVETAGPLGKIIRYVFVYLLGTFSSLVLLFLALVGVYVFIKRKFPKVKINIFFGAVISLILFALIYSSKNDWTMANLMTNYRDIFDSISQEGYITILSSQIAGGLVGHLIYTLLSSFVGSIGTQIICVVFIIGSIVVLIQPIVYKIGNKLMVLSSNVSKEHQKKKKDNEVKPSLIYDNDNEEIIDNSKTDVFSFVDEEVEEVIEKPTVKVEKPRPANSFDIFNNEYNFGTPIVNETPIEKPIKFDIFNDKLFEETDDEILRRDHIDINNTYEDPINTSKPEQSTFGYESDENTQTNNGFINNSYEEPMNTTTSFINDDNNQVGFIGDEEVEEEVNETPSTSYAFPYEEETIVESSTSQEEVSEDEQEDDSNETQEEVSNETPSTEPKPEKKKVYEKPFKNFVIPSLALLDEPINHQEAENRSNAERKGALLNKKLESLGIKARVVNYRISASFTRFEISLDPNSKITLFNNIAQDLMMALSAEKVNVLAPIPGSEYIGVEIPNAVRSSVSLKETLVGTITYSTPPLLIAIGKDAIGEIISFDLAKTPHLLVAGSTGSGKSVCMNAIIMSLLMHNSPNDLKIILIDPKRVEFTAYANIPHLACPVITDVAKAGMALTRLVEFMNDRYKILENIGAKNIEVYNRMMEKQGKDKMEYYVCIVDELADLLMNVKSAENSIKEITQLSRAVGIHMIVATQRPSVDIITGTIKNNIPSRIAFAVTTGADSRTILDSVGAENLLGKGDMLVNITGRLSMTRGQGCNVSDEEIERVVDFIKKQGNPVFNPRFLDLEPPKPVAEEITNSGTPEDDLVNEIIAYMSMGNHVSTTKIQTKFNIGYPRAARIIERLAEANIIYRDPQTKQWALNENTLNTDEE